MTSTHSLRRVRTPNGFISEEYAIRISYPITEENLVSCGESVLAYEALNSFNAEELAEISRTVGLYHRMRGAKKYDIADRLRNEIKRWDESLNVLVSGKIGTWFESVEHRRQRASYRVAKGGAVPYPFKSHAELL